MAQNPLLGNSISLISKKNIRYEGTLYSINETDATVALKDVKSFGTEGREKTEEGCTFVPPQDAVHPYLVFRGCDIKDLHVHEKVEPVAAAKAPASIRVAETKPETKVEAATKQDLMTEATRPNREPKKSERRQPRKPKGKSSAQVGTGASLLNRRERGAVEGVMEAPDNDFDFQSNLNKFEKEEDDDDDSEEELEETEGPPAYHKDDFFDSISCDALDKERGVDNRLRGSTERQLNTETFGAVALNSQRRRRYGGGRGRGGRGRGRGGRGGPRPQSDRWQKGPPSDSPEQHSSTRSGVPS